MKKAEAKILSVDRSRVVMEYITQILSDPENRDEGKIQFVAERVEGKNEPMCVIAISVPDTNYKTRIDSGITAQQGDYFKEQVINDLIDYFLDSDTVNIGLFYSIRGGMGQNFDGITAIDRTGNGSSLKINFGYRSEYLDRVIVQYNEKIKEYQKQREQTKTTEIETAKSR